MTTTLDSLQHQHGASRPPSTMAAITALKPERQFPAMLEAFKSQIAVALPSHMSADRMARVALTAFRQNPKLAECEPMSVFSSVVLSAQLGLEIGVDGQAFLVPYYDNKKRKLLCQFIPGWKGYVELVNRAGKASVWTGSVFAGDAFEYELGDRPFVRHKPMGECDEVKANLTHVYAIGRVHGAETPVIEVWTVARVIRHLNRYNKVGDKHYALKDDTNFIAYGRKVALLQVLKYMPKSVELRAAQAIEAHGSAAADLRDVLNGEWTNVTDQVQAAADAEEATGTEAAAAGATENAEQGGDRATVAAASAADPAEAKKPARQRRTIE